MTAFRSYHSGGSNAAQATEVTVEGAMEQATDTLTLSCRELCALPPQLLNSAKLQNTLTALDVSRNTLDELPPSGLGSFAALGMLDVSCNRLRVLPVELPPNLTSLIALSNSFRPVARSLPLAALAALPKLTLLDLQYNAKLGGEATGAAIREALPKGCEVRLTASRRQVTSGSAHGAPGRPPKPSAAQRDATQLRAQLEPLSTPQLRGRLDRLFGQPTHPDDVDREGVLSRLVLAYEASGPRRIRKVRGVPPTQCPHARNRMDALYSPRACSVCVCVCVCVCVPQVRGVAPQDDAPLDALLELLRATDFPTGAQRERQTVKAAGYMVLPRPLNGASAGEALYASEADPRVCDSHADGSGGSGGSGGSSFSGECDTQPAERAVRESAKARLAAAKLRRHARIFDLAYEIIAGVDSEFAEAYTAIAVTKQFEGSPHIDTENVAPFYGLALGDFTGGEICVESDALEVTQVETRRRLGKIDGRYPHWVAPHTGERYSIIYYVSSGAVVPQGPAVIEVG